MNISSSPAHIWVLPRITEILEPPQNSKINETFIEMRARLIEETLASFGAPSQVVEISRGPRATIFGVEPLFIENQAGQTRVSAGKIASLIDDLALAMATSGIHIQIPNPGGSFVTIEVPNEEVALVTLRDVVDSDTFRQNKSPLRIALGKDIAGRLKVITLESMPHLLIAGTTGSGKSVFVSAILNCLLLNNTPDDLRLLLVDTKGIELTSFNGIPHLLAPVIVETNRVIGALQWMVREMDNRCRMLDEVGAHNLPGYNLRVASQGGKKLPYLLVVIDELSDLMLIAPDEIQLLITRLVKLARSIGIHIILSTSRPSIDVVARGIKAYFPARIAFATASKTDSRIILDQPGAERLLGRGDMFFQAPDAPAPVRLQAVFVSNAEITRLVDYWRQQAGAASLYGAATGTSDTSTESQPVSSPHKQVPMFEDINTTQGDPLLNDAIDIVRREGRASVSILQQRMRIGYTRAARLIDQIEEKGIIGPPNAGTGMHNVLDYGPAGHVHTNV